MDLDGVVFPLPVLAASGCYGVGRDSGGLGDVRRLGGVVTRSLTYDAAKGSPTPRLAESPSGILTSLGGQNAGVKDFLVADLPRLVKTGVPVVVSIAGSSLEEYLRVASALQNVSGITALEVCLSAADEQHGGIPFYARRDLMADVVGTVSRQSRYPVFAKLPPLVPDLVESARTCVRVGAHGLTLIDSVPAMAVDVRKLRPRLATAIGGLSGPAIRPIAVGAVFSVARALPDVPIMGVGGITTGEDAVEFLLAGAWAVQVGTAALVNPSAPAEIAQGILTYLREKGFSSPADLRGKLRVHPEGPA
ncbi:MAG: dihydroorotate dehydrogenase [Actinomycetota bacterium]